MKTALLTSYSAEHILSGLKSNDYKVVNHIYKKYLPLIKAMVLKNSGINEDAEDIFQDAILTILKKVKKNELALTSSFGTFIYSICWHLWLQRLNGKKHVSPMKDHEINNIVETADNESIMRSNTESDLISIVNKNFIRLDSKSQLLLTLFINGKHYSETAKIMHYNSGDYVKTRKYICKERLKSFVMSDPNYSKLMMELVEN